MLRFISFAACIAALLAITAGSQAAVVGADSFEYANGNLDGKGAASGGWGGAWSASAPLDTGEITVVDGGLSYNAGGVTISGGNKSVKMIDSSGVHQKMTRGLDAVETGSDYYFRFLINLDAGTIGAVDAAVVTLDAYYTGNLQRSDEAMAGFYGNVAGQISADVHQGSGGDQVWWPTPIVGDTTYLIIGRYWKDPLGAHFNGTTYNTYNKFNRLDLWVNPDTSDGVGTEDLTSAFTPVTTHPKADVFDGARLWAWNTLDVGEEVLLDEYVLGTTWADVIPEPTTIVLIGLGGLAVIRRRRS